MKKYRPVWQCSRIKDEIIVFSEKDGAVCAGLAFDNPHNVTIRERNGKVLKEGVDYAVKGNAVVLLDKNLFFYNEEWLKNESVPPFIENENKQYDVRDVLLVSPRFLRETQFLADYDCDVTDFPEMVFRGNLEKTVRKLVRGEKLDVILFGDSISNAANSSWEMGVGGYVHWIDAVKKNVLGCCGAEMNVVNVSRSGYGTEWALSAYKEKFKKMKADLVIIAFGMNDSALGAKKFASNVRELIEGIKSFCKETEFIVISSPSANKDCKLFYGQSEQFEELRKTFSGKITLINMSAASDFLMKRKKYIEISGNNLNHPNDFFYEFYESALSETLINAAESEN